MKVKFICSKLILLMCVILSDSMQGQSVPVTRYLDLTQKNIHGPGVLNLRAVEMHSAQAKEQIEKASQNVRLDSFALSSFLQEITLTALNSFTVMTNTLVCNPSCTDFLRGVRIIYAQQNNILVLYYQPVYLCANGGIFRTSSTVKERNYDLCANGNYYGYNGSSFYMLNATQINAMNAEIALYKKKPMTGRPYGVEVKNSFGTWIPFTNTGDPELYNVTEIIYPIDQLISAATFNGVLKLWSVVNAVEVKLSSGKEIVNKHDVIISTQNVALSGTSATIFPDAKFYDYSHICPPSCNGKNFTIKVHE